MALFNAPEFNSVGSNGGFPGMGGGFGYGGGFGGGGFGGLGAIGLFGLIGLDGLRGRDGHGDNDGCGKEAAVLAAISNAKDISVAEARAISSQLGAGQISQQAANYAAAIQAANNKSELAAQATAFAVVADKRFDDLASTSALQTASIIARINQSETDSLRDQLFLERRRSDAKDVEINIQNTNTNIQAQLQAQAQIQAQRDFDHQKRFDVLFSQNAKAGQDIIAVGSLLTGTTQTANPVNVKS